LIKLFWGKATQDKRRKLDEIKDTLCNLDIAGENFYTGFVKNKHSFLGLAEDSYEGFFLNLLKKLQERGFAKPALQVTSDDYDLHMTKPEFCPATTTVLSLSRSKSAEANLDGYTFAYKNHLQPTDNDKGIAGVVIENKEELFKFLKE